MKLARTLVAAALVASVLPACAPLVIGTIAAGTAIVATDRRTTGTQVDDTSIELRVSNELGTAFKSNPKEVHISVNSFERKVLLTGEVPTEQAKAQAGEIASRSLNVRTVVNELTVAPPSTLGQRTNDTTIGTKVRAQFVNTKEIPVQFGQHRDRARHRVPDGFRDGKGRRDRRACRQPRHGRAAGGEGLRLRHAGGSAAPTRRVEPASGADDLATRDIGATGDHGRNGQVRVRCRILASAEMRRVPFVNRALSVGTFVL